MEASRSQNESPPEFPPYVGIVKCTDCQEPIVAPPLHKITCRAKQDK